jgi:hypothetical protein
MATVTGVNIAAYCHVATGCSMNAKWDATTVKEELTGLDTELVEAMRV